MPNIDTLKPFVVIIEGCDKTGKSSLALKLMEDFGYKNYVHLGSPTKEEQDDPLEFHMKHIRQIKERNVPTVIDRFHLSNLVYGRLLKHKHLNKTQLETIEKELKSLKASIIFTWRDQEKIKESFITDKETLINPSMIKPIEKEYWHNLYYTDIPYITYNFEVDGPMTSKLLTQATKPVYG